MGDTPVRLNKFLAQNGVASRRGADELVFAGRVRINGTVADSPGIKVIEGRDTVDVDGKPVKAAPSSDGLTILLHKPVHTVTTAKDPQGRKTVLELLPREVQKQRPFPVGRLDYFSEGLLLLTTDGELCYRLTHPKWHLPKVYLVTIKGKISSQDMETMEKGMTLAEGETLAPVKVKSLPPRNGKQVLELTLMQGINRQIRRMCRDLGLTILTLKRIKQGPVKLGNLGEGKWRELSQEELADLKKAVKL
ncbi:pseudouridine synthase [Salidesulfovibrio onnuriiensis]|uniref:pseudouridine synthase n=1 Tax=Salidesulfovibrio onnuriiensis TaxID=2583823 RepID=UPI0011C76E9F|nr:pseudouridine synthase [Salidesulfovibrio onnuriiensis]